MLRPNLSVAATAIALLSSAVSQAISVSWSGLQSIASNDDIVNPSGVVSATNFGNNGDITVSAGGNEITFVQDTVGGIASAAGDSFFNPTGTTVTADFEKVLDSFGFFNGAGTTTRTFSGLTPGQTYTIQTFAADDRGQVWDGMSFTVNGVASPAHTNAGTDEPLNTSRQSTFAVATVTLDAGETSLDVVISCTNTSVVNALVVSQAGVSALPQLEIEPRGSDLVFTWVSQAGKVYDLLSSIDPQGDGDPDTWAVVTGQEGILSEPPSNQLTITRPNDPTRLYVVRERNAPPPPPVFFDDFETDTGWTTGTNGGDTGTTVWERGAPAADGFGPDSGFDGSTNCFGTNLTAFYGTNTDIYLRSPEIDLSASGLTGATLSMAQFLDNDSFDPAAIRVLKSSDLSPLGDVATGLWNPKFDTLWDQFAPTALPAAAIGEKVILEFQFTSDGTTEFDGWYIDNVQVDAQ